MSIMDNQVTKYIKNFLTNKECKLQVVEPHNHRVNAAEQVIQTFKDAFIDKSIANVFCFGAFANKISRVVYND